MACHMDTDGSGKCQHCANQDGCLMHRCWFCHSPVHEGDECCENPDCIKRKHELDEDEKRHERAELIKAVKSAIQRRSKDDGEYNLGRLQRWFYTVKLLVCVLIRNQRYQRDDEDYPVRVSTYHYQELYAGWECSDIVVGHGVFKGWFYNLETDGDWCM